MPPQKKYTAMLPSTPAPMEIADKLLALAAIRGVYRTDLMRAAVAIYLEDLSEEEKRAISHYLTRLKSTPTK